MHAVWIPALGWAAGLASLAAGIPQVLKLLQTRDSDGVSSWTYTLWLALLTFWAAWAYSVHAVPSIVMNLLGLPIIAAVIVLLRPTRNEKLFLCATVAVAATGLFVYPPGLAMLAAAVQLTVAIPSLRLALRSNEELTGVSIGTWVLILAACIGYLAYDASIGYPAAGLAGCVSIVAAVVIVAKALRFRRGLELTTMGSAT